MFALGIGLVGLLLAGCAGSNDVQYKETETAKPDLQYTQFTFEQQDPAVPVPVALRSTLKNDMENTFAQRLRSIQAYRDRLGLKPRIMTVQYRVVGYDPGTPWLRSMLGMFGVGAAHLNVDSRYLDDHGRQVGATRIIVGLADKPELLQSDTDLFGDMFVTTTVDYLKKDFLLQDQGKK
jgi:hypothetical protein